MGEETSENQVEEEEIGPVWVARYWNMIPKKWKKK